MKKALSFVLVMLLLVSVLPMSVFAATEYDLTVNGVKFTSSNLTVACGSGTATFNPNTNTLTLNSAQLSKGMNVDAVREKAYIASELPSLNIKLIGTTVCEAGNDWDYQLYSSGSVTVSGSGSIETNRGQEPSYTKVAVFGDLTLKDTSLYRWTTYEDYPLGGDLILDNSVATYFELEVQGEVIIRDSTVKGEQFIGDIGYYDDHERYQQLENATAYQRTYLKSEKGFTVTDSTLFQTDLEASYYGEVADAELNNVTMDYSIVDVNGALTAKTVRSSCTERAADSDYQFEKCALYAKKAVVINDCDLQFTEIRNGSGAKDTIETADTKLDDCTVHAYGDMNMDFCKFNGVKLEVEGSLYCIRSIVGANREGQNSPIAVHGDRVDIINCDFSGIAETNQGSRTVYLGNGLPATETYDYYTFSGASLRVFRTDYGNDTATVVNLTDSRLLMDSLTLQCTLNINESRLQLCMSGVDEELVTMNGNIEIVSGAWNAGREFGIFIDYLGDYYTFDEETGVLTVNNAYGARGWGQRVCEYVNGELIYDEETIAKVKKIVFNTDDLYYLGWDLYMYPNLEEFVDNGTHNVNISGNIGERNKGRFTNVEKITFGPDALDIGANPQYYLPTVKTIVIRNANLPNEEGYNYEGEIKSAYGTYDPRATKPALEKIYVPAAEVARWKSLVADYYKDKIFALYILGDTDMNCVVDINDAAFIQRSAAGVSLPFTLNKQTANVDGDKNVTVMDATFIQRYLAEMKVNYNIGEQVD